MLEDTEKNDEYGPSVIYMRSIRECGGKQTLYIFTFKRIIVKERARFGASLVRLLVRGGKTG